MTDTRQMLAELTTRRARLLQNLVEPVRAAVNAMKDAGLTRSADPVAEVLFQLDALDAEMKQFLDANLQAVVDMIIGQRGGPQ